MAQNLVPPASAADQEAMHDLYRRGGGERKRAPHVVYAQSTCPHPGCDQHMQAIDFRLEDLGRTVHDPLVAAWWNDIGFAGRCPKCGGWIHFTIREKRALTADEAQRLPRLPDAWQDNALVL
jgi:hypothetical protein